jgi:hypothetical protein
MTTILIISNLVTLFLIVTYWVMHSKKGDLNKFRTFREHCYSCGGNFSDDNWDRILEKCTKCKRVDKCDMVMGNYKWMVNKFKSFLIEFSMGTKYRKWLMYIMIFSFIFSLFTLLFYKVNLFVSINIITQFNLLVEIWIINLCKSLVKKSNSHLISTSLTFGRFGKHKI